MFVVSAWSECVGLKFFYGPFLDREKADDCALIVAGKPDVHGAVVCEVSSLTEREREQILKGEHID